MLGEGEACLVLGSISGGKEASLVEEKHVRVKGRQVWYWESTSGGKEAYLVEERHI